MEMKDYEKDCERVLKTADSIFYNKNKEMKLALCAMLSGRHLLLEDVPGVGKTTLAYFLSHIFGLDLSRIQCTNDLLPSDIIGTMIFKKSIEDFEFKKGPLFGDIILADELNRASPKTQSAFLQAMEEKCINIDRVEFGLSSNFLIIATQNPVEQVGTFPLPESQLDRFFMSLSLGFPSREFERKILKSNSIREEIKKISPVFNSKECLELRLRVEKVEYTEDLLDYVLDIISYGRNELENGYALSPRSGKDLLKAAKACAFLSQRSFVTPEDIRFVLPGVLSHRLGGKRGRGYGLEQSQKVLDAVSV